MAAALAVAEIVALFTTDGVATAAMVVAELPTTVELVEDATKIRDHCLERED